MKFGKEEIKKTFLGGLVLFALLYVYFNIMLAPLAKKEKAYKKEIVEIQPKVATADSQIKTAAAIEKSAPEANEVLEHIKAMIPEGAPIAWFPPRMVDFFKRQGIEKCSVRLNNEVPEKELLGFKKLFWAIDIPKVEFVPLGIAISGLENEELLLEITNIKIEEIKDEAQYQRATLTVSTLVKQ